MEEKMLFQMLEILYPRRCAVCDEIEVTGKVFVRYVKTRCMWQENRHVKKCGKTGALSVHR